LLKKISLRLRGFKMHIIGYLSLIIATISGLYSGISFDTKLMRHKNIIWLPIFNFREKALKAITKLQKLDLPPSDDKNDNGKWERLGDMALSIRRGIISKKDEGFREIVRALKFENIINRNIDSIIMTQATYLTYDAYTMKSDNIIQQSFLLKIGNESVESSLKSLNEINVAVNNLRQLSPHIPYSLKPSFTQITSN